MKLNQLSSTTTSKKKRVGRGYGSGKGGHTAGRGAKGQKARSKVPLYFEGTAMRKSLIRRLPMLRGKKRFKPFKSKPLILNLEHLSLLPKNSTVTIETLAKAGLVKLEDAKQLGVKILGQGKLTRALSVALPTSKSAAAKIKKAGGKLIKPKPAVKPKPIKKTTKPAAKKAIKSAAKKTIKPTAKKAKTVKTVKTTAKVVKKPAK